MVSGGSARGLGRLTRVGLAAVIGLGGAVFWPLPAQACGCGALVANDPMTPVEETSLITLDPDPANPDGFTETITMNLVTQTVADDAAFVMPVPSQATFDLADPKLFGDLDELTKPDVRVVEEEIDGDGAGAGAPDGLESVNVTDQVTLGPYDVVQLSGEDPTAVAQWLTTNGFQLQPELADGLATYLDEGWLVVAVRLTSTDQRSLGSGLPPMRLTFPVDQPIYPLRLSALAEEKQKLRLYVLADHRMDVSNPMPGTTGPGLTFAGWVDPSDLANYPTFAAEVPTRRFLTRYDASVAPGAVRHDATFTQADKDEAYRDVVTEVHYVSERGPDTGTIVLIGAGVVLAAGLVAWLVVGIRRAR